MKNLLKWWEKKEFRYFYHYSVTISRDENVMINAGNIYIDGSINSEEKYNAVIKKITDAFSTEKNKVTVTSLSYLGKKVIE